MYSVCPLSAMIKHCTQYAFYLMSTFLLPKKLLKQNFSIGLFIVEPLCQQGSTVMENPGKTLLMESHRKWIKNKSSKLKMS